MLNLSPKSHNHILDIDKKKKKDCDQATFYRGKLNVHTNKVI